MTKYVEVIYPEDKENQYPRKLAKYLYNRFMKTGSQQNTTRKILDIGCCTGKALKRFSEFENFDLYGIDIRDEGVEDIYFKSSNLEKETIPYPDNYFDIVYSKSVLEHVQNTDNFISESRRVIKPGGIVIILTPDWVSCMDVFWDDYTHVRAFSRKSLRDAFIIHKFDKVECEHFYQLPFVWRHHWLKAVPWLISFLPNFLKWKDREQRNTKDRKLIRFSIEKMLLVTGTK